MMQKKIEFKSHPGVTSLLVVLGLSLFMITLVSGIAALSLREQQQTRNVEFSNKALRIAEAGVKVAAQRLATDPGYTKTSCEPGTDYAGIMSDGDSSQAVTCVEVRSDFTAYEGFVERDKSSQLIIDTPPENKGPNSIELSWYHKTLDQELSEYAYPNSSFYPTAQNPLYKWAPSIEMNFVYWPKNNNLGTPGASMQTATIFFTPGRPDQSQNGVDTQCEGQSGVSMPGQYRCMTKSAPGKTGFDLSRALRMPGGTSSQDYNFMIRTKPRYKETHFQLVAYDVDGKPINVKSTSAQIDITARAGGTYRRIKAEKTIIPTVLDNLFDSVLYVGNGSNDEPGVTRDICKNLVVKADYTLAPTSNAPLCTPN